METRSKIDKAYCRIEPFRVLYLNVKRNVRQHMMKLVGIRRFARSVGWEVCPIAVEDLAGRNFPDLLAHLRPAGIIVECTEEGVKFPLRDLNQVPCVFLSCLPSWHGNKVYKVYNDPITTVGAAVRELASTRPNGYAVIGYCEPRDWSRLRERTFVRQIASLGVACHRFSFCSSSEERRRRLMEFLSRLPKATAIFAVNDETARETAEAAGWLGRCIPRDFTLVGVDNLEDVCESGSLSLSSVQIDFERAGYLAAQKLHEVIQGKRNVLKISTFGPLFTFRRQSTRGNVRRSTKVQELIDFIRERACDGISVSDVVAVAGTSRRLVELRFRESTGHSIHDEIEQVRMDRVMQLLLDRTVSLPVILDQSGYSSARALRKAFHRRTGCSLLDWRNINAFSEK